MLIWLGRGYLRVLWEDAVNKSNCFAWGELRDERIAVAQACCVSTLQVSRSV